MILKGDEDLSQYDEEETEYIRQESIDALLAAIKWIDRMDEEIKKFKEGVKDEDLYY